MTRQYFTRGNINIFNPATLIRNSAYIHDEQDPYIWEYGNSFSHIYSFL